MALDDISQAVLSRDEVVRYLKGTHGESSEQARERVYAYLDELRTKQRYTLYRALKHPVYPILRKIRRHVEHIDRAVNATRESRVMYASNHKSHTDYLVEPLVLDDNGVRPPIIAAGINLFGGPLGLLHRHVTGAVPIRRATKDPAYLVTLKAYIAELLRAHDLLFYIEGGRSYSGELRPPKTGLIHAAMQSDTQNLVILPIAVSYDLVLEDRILARQGVKKRQRPFTRELAEMMRYAVGYRSRAFITFGTPIATSEYDPQSRRDVLDLAHRTREAIGLLYKVTPTALVAAALRRSMSRAELETQIDRTLDQLRQVGANLAVESGRQAVAEASQPLERRGVLVVEPGRYRVRNRMLLRYYARTIEHLLAPAAPRSH
ncbi:MAG TPA: 1-acyl-sn-glycerol-3-phosphate acyltransferase [Vicinamibacterales bacterium]|jgi:glycerol-3-phosphate O-acyltransferase